MNNINIVNERIPHRKMPYTLLKHDRGVQMVHENDVRDFVNLGKYEHIDHTTGITMFITIICVSSEQSNVVYEYVKSILNNLSFWVTKVILSSTSRGVFITTTTSKGVYIDALCQLFDGKMVNGSYIHTHPNGNDVIVRGCCMVSTLSSSNDEDDDVC